MLTQLNPLLPVYVIAGNGWPSGPGYCVAWLDYSQEHFTLWKIVMDSDGAAWDIPQSHVRLQFNPSMGRPERPN